MRIIRGIERVAGFRRPWCLTIGTFDGVHVGHQAVIRQVVQKAASDGLTSVVMTFDPHPLVSLGKVANLPLLTCTPHKLSLLEKLGIDVCVVVELDDQLAGMSASDFVTEIVHARLHVAGVVAGARSRFGKDRKGTLSVLKRLGAKLGFWVDVVDEVLVGGLAVSSTLVRRSVMRGDLSAAEAFLGRRFSAFGRVVRGRNIGRALGYRTANLKPLDQVLPPAGVYAVEVVVDRETHAGAVNLGRRPTFSSEGADSPVLEVHILDFDRAIYRRRVEVVFHCRIRDERKFAAADELRRQIALDIEAVKRYFDGRTSGGSSHEAKAAASRRGKRNQIC
jgi:riboflavin kinase/FMN adenylyltransferase